jgi:hypothetical protein
MATTITFKKDNPEGTQAIIDQFLKFIIENFVKRQKVKILLPGGKTTLPMHKMLYEEDVDYCLVDAFTAKKEHCNYVLQFTAHAGYTLGADNSIWIDEGCEVTFDKEITIKRTNGDIWRITAD